MPRGLDDGLPASCATTSEASQPLRDCRVSTATPARLDSANRQGWDSDDAPLQAGPRRNRKRMITRSLSAGTCRMFPRRNWLLLLIQGLLLRALPLAASTQQQSVKAPAAAARPRRWQRQSTSTG